MRDELTHAAAEVCAEEETWARAEYFSDRMTEAQRREFGEAGDRPWRGLIGPRKRRLIAAVEALGVYHA